MHTYIKNLHSKPEHIRKQMLVGVLAVSMLLVGSVWVYGFASPRTSSAQATSENTSKPFALFKTSMASLYENLTANVGSAKSSMNGASEEKQIDLIPVEKTQ